MSVTDIHRECPTYPVNIIYDVLERCDYYWLPQMFVNTLYREVRHAPNISRILNTFFMNEDSVEMSSDVLTMRESAKMRSFGHTAKVGIETKCHEAGSFGGWGKCEQTHTQDARNIDIDHQSCDCITVELGFSFFYHKHFKCIWITRHLGTNLS